MGRLKGHFSSGVLDEGRSLLQEHLHQPFVYEWFDS